MYELWYDYIKPKYGEKEKLCYMGTGYIDNWVHCIHENIFIIDIYKDITEDVETRFDTSNHELDRLEEN